MPLQSYQVQVARWLLTLKRNLPDFFVYLLRYIQVQVLYLRIILYFKSIE